MWVATAGNIVGVSIDGCDRNSHSARTTRSREQLMIARQNRIYMTAVVCLVGLMADSAHAGSTINLAAPVAGQA